MSVSARKLQMLLFVLLVTISPAFATNNLDIQEIFQHVDASFRQIDHNHDGYYGHEEMAEEFRKMDTNHDNHLSREEFVSPYSTSGHSLASGVFSLLDTNGDGTLGDESTTALHMSLDSDHDGRVSRPEFDHFYGRLMMYVKTHQSHDSHGEYYH